MLLVETTDFCKGYSKHIRKRHIFGVDLFTYQLLCFMRAGEAADVALPDDPHTATPIKHEPNHSLKTTPKKTESEELFSCTECSKDFQSVYARDVHLREKHGKRPLHVDFCGQTFNVSQSLIVHQRIYHPSPAAASVEPEEERSAPKTYVCSTCGKQLPTSDSLKRHLIIHSGKKPYRCTMCGRGFTQIGNLKTHQKVHEGESADTSSFFL